MSFEVRRKEKSFFKKFALSEVCQAKNGKNQQKIDQNE